MTDESCPKCHAELAERLIVEAVPGYQGKRLCWRCAAWILGRWHKGLARETNERIAGMTPGELTVQARKAVEDLYG